MLSRCVFITSLHLCCVRLQEGNKRRQVGATAMNAVSSRSHSIFTVIIEASETRRVAIADVIIMRTRV